MFSNQITLMLEIRKESMSIEIPKYNVGDTVELFIIHLSAMDLITTMPTELAVLASQKTTRSPPRQIQCTLR